MSSRHHITSGSITTLLVVLAGCSTGGNGNSYSKGSRSQTAAATSPVAAPAFATKPVTTVATTVEVPLAQAHPLEAPVYLTINTNTNTNAAAEAPAAIENVTRITFASEGADFDPAVSHDGATLIFASTQHRTTSDIYLKSVASRVVTRLTNDPGDDVQPAISPDGTRIAFASNRNGNWDIFVMSVSGGQAVQWTDDAADDLHPSWSPDGKQLVFSRYGEVSGRWELWISGMSGKNAAPAFIGYGMFPEWCPLAGAGELGGEKILFQMGRERGSRTFGIWTLEYKDGQTTNLTEIASSSATALINPTWSPDGNHVVYTQVPAQGLAGVGRSKTSRPQTAELFLAATDGSSRIRLTSGPAISMFPRWSGANSLFFVSDRGGHDNIWSMDLSTALLAMGDISSQHTLKAAADHPLKAIGQKETGITIHESKVAGVDETTDNPAATENEPRK